MTQAGGRPADPALVAALRVPGLADDPEAMVELAGGDVEALIEAVAEVLDDPVVTAERASSFVLHAPLELLARVQLRARSTDRDQLADARLVSLAARYALHRTRSIDGGPPSSADRRPAHAAGVETAEGGEPQLVELAEAAATSTAAAGHANIYVHLRSSGGPAPRAPMVRGLRRELAKDPDARVDGPGLERPASSRASASPSSTDVAATIEEAWRAVGHVAPPTAGGVAALVAHVQAHAGADLARLVATVQAAAADDPDAVRRHLLRLAAGQMLAGDEAFVPYGWTHALTLTEGAATVAGMIAEPGRAWGAAAVYAAAFWAAHGTGPLPAIDALGSARAEAVDPPEWVDRARAAARAHDAHLVKYTLSCLRCAEDDPAAGGLFAAAADRLHRWWAAHPPGDDPLIDRIDVERG